MCFATLVTAKAKFRLGGCILHTLTLHVFVCVCVWQYLHPLCFFCFSFSRLVFFSFLVSRDCSKVLVWQFCFSVRFRLFFFFFSNFYSSFVFRSSSAAAAAASLFLPRLCVGDFCFCLLVLCFVSSVSARHQRQFHY